MIRKLCFAFISVILSVCLFACDSGQVEINERYSTSLSAIETARTPTPTPVPASTPTPMPTPVLTPTPVPTQEPETPPSECTYIGNKNSHKLHYPTCSSVSDMAEHNKDYLTCSYDEAIAMGYIPCLNCFPETDESAPRSEVPTEVTYIGNKNTKKFHYPSCSSVGQMKEKNKDYLSCSREDAVGMGYVPCKRCNP